MKNIFSALGALTFILLGTPVAHAQSLLDVFIGKRSHLEFTVGLGLLGRQERTVFNELSELGTGILFFNPRHYYFKTDFLVDFDFKNSVRLSPNWGILYGFGMGAMRYDIYLASRNPNHLPGGSNPLETEHIRNFTNYSARALVGVSYSHPISERAALTAKAYAGAQPNGVEIDYRQNSSIFGVFGGDLLYLRSFAGFEIGYSLDHTNGLLLLPNSSISYRYLHFFGGQDYLASHTLVGLHQIVLGVGLRQNSKPGN